MPSNQMINSYNQVPQTLINRSIFDRSFKHSTTLDSGYLVPIFTDEILPGDTIDLSATLFARLATQVVPFMDNAYIEFHLWFVPRRLVWDNWQKFMGEQLNPGDSIDYLIPQVESPSKTGCLEGELLTYLGMPIRVPDFKIDACYPRSYNLVYNEWYRSEILQDSVPVPKDDGPDDITNYKLLRRGKRGDYFTNATPAPQKGAGVELPLGGTAPVFGNGMSLGLQSYKNNPQGLDKVGLIGHNDSVGAWFYGSTGSYGKMTSDTTAGGGNYNSAGKIYGVTTEPDKSGLICDLSTATAATINTLRQAIALQQFLEKDMRGGTRYIELVFSHFGVVSPDARLQRPEFLGSFSAHLNQNTVAQTSQTTQGENGSPQANLSAYSTFSVQGNNIVHSFTEHGILLGICQIRADLSYQYGCDRALTRRTRYDFFWPEFAHLGDQEIRNKEIYAQGNEQDDEIFGYTERYGEYRIKNNLITGRLNSRAQTPLDVWHLAQKFAKLPVLNDEFIQDTPDFKRVIAVQDEPEFILDADFQYYHTRPIPVYGIPGLERI